VVLSVLRQRMNPAMLEAAPKARPIGGITRAFPSAPLNLADKKDATSEATRFDFASLDAGQLVDGGPSKTAINSAAIAFQPFPA